MKILKNLNNIKLLDIKCMNFAIEQAKMAFKIGEIPIGAAISILSTEKIIGLGYNKTITNNDPTAHAEIIAIRKASKNNYNYRLCEASIYITTEPCLMCMGAIINSRIKNVIFGSYNTKYGVCGSLLNITKIKNLNKRIYFTGGILKNKCCKIANSFFYKNNFKKNRF